MQDVVAKFKVNSVIRCEHTTELRMSPVFSTNPDSENKKFWDATPSGTFEMQVTNNSLEGFHPGDEYYVTLARSERGEDLAVPSE